MEFDEFHRTIVSLGFFQFFGICLQRMDQPTTDKFKYINSTNLWSMVNELFKSEDLLRLVETKEVSIDYQVQTQLLN